MTAARGSSSSSCFKTDGALIVTFPTLKVAPRFLPTKPKTRCQGAAISTVGL